jgi:hypothetical protein
MGIIYSNLYRLLTNQNSNCAGGDLREKLLELIVQPLEEQRGADTTHEIGDAALVRHGYVSRDMRCMNGEGYVDSDVSSSLTWMES